ncbi:MAG: PAS domain S-box protein, partial [Thermodesulfobacteriota bacterium]|nr:PAS domain S-box protein [Thermodesulfobacteriota bacterium]
LGVDIPEEANPQVITNEMNLVKKNIGDREVEALINLPELNDPHKLAVARIFTSCMTVVYTSAPEYFPLIVLKLVNLSLKHGNSIYSPFAYAAFGVILCGRLGEIETGYGFGEMALKLIDKFHTEVLKAKIYYVFGDMINHWKNHYREDLPYLLESYRSGSEAGDLSFASYAMNHYVMTSFLMGEPLGEVREKLERNYEVIQKYQQWSVIQEYKLLFQMVLNLNGEAEDKLRIKGDMTDEGKIVPEWERANMITAIGYYTVEKQFLLYLYRDYKGSIDTAVVGERCLETMTGMNLFAEYHFYYSLALLAHYPDTSIDEQKDYLKKVKTYQEKMEKWASHAPANFEHKFLLLEAEISRLNGEIKSTISLFDRAIESARRNSFIQDEAIANERAALFYLSEGMKKIARLYMQEAHKGYKRWGAVMKVSDLEEEYPYLSAEPGVDRTFIPDDRQSKRPPQPDASMILDYKSTVKSLQAISSEIILEDLMNKLMKIVVEISGATRGLVILFKEGKLSVEAERIVLDKEVSIVHSFPLDKRDDLLIPLINYVRRTKEYVVLSDAQKEGNFTLDPYVLKNQSKSICCLPIIRQSRPVGILYLENTIATGAFTPDRMEILRLFATQAAISIENALLVDSMAKAERALRHSEEEYRNLIERANDGIVIVQHEVFKYVNQKMAKMVGYTVDELINEHISKFIHPDDYPRVLDQNKRRMAGEKSPEIYEIRLIHRDGYSLSIEVNAGTSTYNHRTAGLIFCRDITERKRVEEELTKHREHLEELVGERTAQLKATQQELVAKERLATLGKVTATVSHEIRNPLGTIRTSLYSINERVRGKGLCIEETLARAERSIVRCDRIIEELLDFTRSRDLYPEPTVIDEWLDQTLDEHVIPEGITLTWKPGAGVEISLDREHFRRCLVNIMDNAIKAIEEKRENMISRGRELGVDHLIVESRVVEDRFELRITDTGTGIPSDHLEKIFEPLFSTRGFGVGLGLVIVKRIMEQHGGGIKIDSKTDKGTTVTLWLLTGE